MRALAVGLAFACVAAGVASADTMGAIKANTLVLTDRNGAETALILEGDGDYTSTTKSGEAHGKWSLNDVGRFCFKPSTATSEMCLPVFPSDKAVGDEWDVMGPTGSSMYTARIAAGHVKLNKE